MKRIGLLLILLPLLISTASAAATISIGNGSAGVGGTVVVPLMINDVTGAGSVEVNLTYDPSVVIPVNITNSDSDFDLPPQDPPINPESGYVIINAMQFAAGLDGSVKIGNITLQAVGGEGSSSPLSLKDVILQNMTMQDIPIDGVINGTFTIPSTGGSTTNGGGGGGGGGGTSGEAFENVVCTETDREYVNKESYIGYHYERECNIVEYINFTAVTSSGDIAAKVEILKNTSTLVDKAPPGTVFKNLNIWVGNLGWATEKNIKDPVIGFKVDRSWVNLNNIDESTITMYRYNEGQWNPLTTIKKWEDAGHLYFEAQTPGFSPFAITGSSSSATAATYQIVETGKEPGTVAQTTAPEVTPASTDGTQENIISGFMIAIFAVLYIVIIFLSNKIRQTVLFCKDELKDPDMVEDMNSLIRGPDLYDGRFKGIPLTKQATRLFRKNPIGKDLLRFNRLILESAYSQDIKVKLHERFNLKHWMILAFILFVPLVGFIDIIGIPLNWLIGILLELVCIIYLASKLKYYTVTSTAT